MCCDLEHRLHHAVLVSHGMTMSHQYMGSIVLASSSS